MSVPRPLYDTNPQAWRALVYAVKIRARGRCEWCQIRPVENTHHRFGYGQETLDCLMAVCRQCHVAIHGRTRRMVVVAPGSLCARGDAGLGNTETWKSYLKAGA